MRQPRWLDRKQCAAIHEMILAQYGGLPGIRDEGLLESALAKPRNLFAYSSPNLADLAASSASGIVRNHPFLDGNKRTGFMLAVIFLELNGFLFTATEESVVQNTLALAAGKLKVSGYAGWLKNNLARKP